MTETQNVQEKAKAEPRRRKRRWVSLILALVIFFGGFVCGASTAIIGAARGLKNAIQHPERAPHRITERLRRKLDLSDEQAAKVEQIIAEHQRELLRIRREAQPRVEAELEQIHREVGGVLNEKQKEKWDETVENIRRNWMPR